MELVVTKACGLDVHQAQVTACVLSGEGTRPHKLIQQFSTVKEGLEELRAWIAEQGVTHVAMEGTGVYWMPVYVLLEGRFDLTVCNAKHIKKVPGRKTDACDAEWIATLLRYGLLRKSFVPPAPIRELRDLVRYRETLVQQRSNERNRLLKVLEQAGVKISTFVSDPFGVSGTEMIRALAEGKLSPEQMARMARGKLRSKMPQLTLALDGMLAEHHRLLLGLQLDRLDHLEQSLDKLQAAIDSRVQPYRAQLDLMCTIPGVDRTAAIRILAEVGSDMSTFATPSRLASWAGVCPGNNQSAGKSRGGRHRSGNPHLQSTLVECAWAACRKKHSYLRAKYYRLKARCGGRRAAMAIGHKILNAVHRVLTTGEPYKDLGEAYLDPNHRRHAVDRLVGRLHALGYDIQGLVDLTQPQPATQEQPATQ